ncbi:MAG: hypothetical protein QOH68_449 [Nocardioidaceae bacterium]|nr:hypothetical protein [Nocardioidaceae bacterium]
MSDSSGVPAKKAAAAKKTPAKKTPAKKTPAKKAAATKKTPTEKAAAAKKTPTKKTPTKKAPATRTSTARLKVSTRSATAKLRESSAALAKSAPTSKFFTRAQKRAKSILQNPDQLKKLAEETSTRAGGKAGPFAEVVDELKTMIRLVAAYTRGDYRDISVETLVLVVAAMIYVVSPLDLIPDVVPVVGYLDDAALVAWVVGRVRGELDDFRSWESNRT